MKVSVGRMMHDQGIERVAERHEEWLDAVRARAWAVARAKGVVSINDLRPYFVLPEGAHHNLWGTVFRTADFAPVGITRVEHPEGHARTVRVYALTLAGLNLSSALES